MNTDLDALATRLYVTVDDLLKDHPEWAPERPAVGIVPRLCDAELITLSVIQALLGYTSEPRMSNTIRTARSRSSTGYFCGLRRAPLVAMIPSSFPR
jgi:hypothetical protein